MFDFLYFKFIIIWTYNIITNIFLKKMIKKIVRTYLFIGCMMLMNLDFIIFCNFSILLKYLRKSVNKFYVLTKCLVA